MTQRAGEVIGTIKLTDLIGVLGSTLEVIKSANEKARYPFFIRTPFGPIMFNNPKGQAAIVDHTRLDLVVDQSTEPVPIEEETTGDALEKPPGFSLGKFLFGAEND